MSHKRVIYSQSSLKYSVYSSLPLSPTVCRCFPINSRKRNLLSCHFILKVNL